MEKIISYSLYGKHPMYLQGALRNAEQVKQFYPGWSARFYVGASVPIDLRDALQRLGASVIAMSGPEDASAMMWRFLPLAESNVGTMISRDSDSRFSERETAAVQEWLEGSKSFHIMRDHPWHNTPILGGMWGARGNLLRDMAHLLTQFRSDGRKGSDQIFLATQIYPRIRTVACVHDSFFGYELVSKAFPNKRKNLEFVGEIFDEHEQPVEEHRQALLQTMQSPLKRTSLYVRTFFSGRKAWHKNGGN